MKKQALRITAIAVFLLLLAVSLTGFAEEIGPDLILRGEIDSPLKLEVSEAVYTRLAQFGEERLASLNKLIRHLGIRINMDGDASETSVLIDEDAVFSFTDTETDSGIQTVYSFDPDHAYGSASESAGSGETDFTGFLNEQFFFMNRMLDDLYPLFGKLTATFPDFTKEAAENLNFKGYGKAVRRISIRFADDYVKEHFPKALADLAVTDESRRFIEGLVFSGVQRVTLLYDENGNVLRINYDGLLGQDEKSIRRVSLVWRCLRTDGQKKDKVTLKTPAVKGYDRYNMSYVREYDVTDPARHTTNWTFELDLKAGDVKKKVTFNADLINENDELTGKSIFTERENGLEKKTTLIPAIRKENGGQYAGTLEITKYSGKIIMSSVKAAVSLGTGTSVYAYGAADVHNRDSSDQVQEMIETLLVQKLLTLPQSDLEFFSKDIPEDVWNTITDSLK